MRLMAIALTLSLATLVGCGQAKESQDRVDGTNKKFSRMTEITKTLYDKYSHTFRTEFKGLVKESITKELNEAQATEVKALYDEFILLSNDTLGAVDGDSNIKFEKGSRDSIVANRDTAIEYAKAAERRIYHFKETARIKAAAAGKRVTPAPAKHR